MCTAPGVVKVRLDVYQTPKPIESGGRWCVQFGAFHSERQAIRLKSQLMAKYPGANVIEFPGQESSFLGPHPSPGRQPGAGRGDRQTIAPARGGSLPSPAWIENQSGVFRYCLGSFVRISVQFLVNLGTFWNIFFG